MVLDKAGKKEKVRQIALALKKYPVVGLVNLQNLPSRQLFLVKSKLRGKAELFMARHTLLELAVKQARPDLEPLLSRIKGSSALVATELDAFKLYSLIKKNKSKAFAKSGQIAPNDIIVPAGDTSLPPGPALAELKAAKIDARIQGPKITVARDSLVTKKGEAILAPVAAALQKLGIAPMTVGMSLPVVFDHGTMFEESVLDIDEQKYYSDLVAAVQYAVNLGVYAEIFTEQTTQPIVMKAARTAIAVKKLVDDKSAGGAKQDAPAMAEQATAPAQAAVEQPAATPVEPTPAAAQA
ncbi:50S ribosomal protein L10 [Candidatus Micrarchaeota archaeon]|nr:50S ribosomal protein L10 [Candidatus Micrarchaeota archaeon]